MERSGLLFVILVALLGSCLADYEGYEVFRFIPKTRRQVSAIHNIENELGDEVSVWNDKVFLNHPVSVHTSPKMKPSLTSYMEKHGLTGEVVIPDIAKLIRDQVSKRTKIVNPLEDFSFEEYHTLAEIDDWLHAIVEAHSDVAELLTIGTSFEGRPIYAVRLSTDLSSKKPVIWMDAGIHAREWIAPATMVYIIDRVLSTYDTDEVIQRSLATHDWYFMAVYNTDGYEYSWTGNRLWRKTRTPNANSPCTGTDPNRNWDIEWGTTNGVSHNPCSDAFCGPTPWSEPSVRAVGFYLRDSIDVDVYIAYHNFGEMFMLPYGYTDEKAADFDEMMVVCQAGADRVEAVHGVAYRCNSLINLVGENSGSSVDYMYDVVRTKFSFAVELRDRGQTGFLLPPAQILPTAEENYPFVLQVVESFLDDQAAKKH